MFIYAGMTRQELDREYSPSSRAPEFLEVLGQYRARSQAARASLACRLDVPYGPHPAERFDFFPPPRPGAPLHVFVHGGHWQESSKDDAAFVASGLVADGAAFAALGYGLAPHRGLPEMAGSVRRGLRWLRAHAEELGCRPNSLYASGSSAGAHLIAMAVSTGGFGEPAEVDGACLLSGVYDLEPVRLSYVNDAVGMDRTVARAMSPLHHLPLRATEIVVARGAAETREYARQHDDLVRALRTHGQPVIDVVQAGRNHFDIPFDLGDSATRLGRAAREQWRLS